jgi:hypothetical protein
MKILDDSRPRGSLFLRLLGTTLALGIGFALCGCGGQGARILIGPPTGWATSAELHWLTSYGQARPAVLRVSTRSCASRLRLAVGPPPTARLRPALRTLSAACMAAKAGRVAEARSLISRADTEALVGAGQDMPSRLDDTPHAAGETNHTASVYNRAASMVARKPVTVRCWSPGDWSQLTAEVAVIIPTSHANSSTQGLTIPDSSAVNLSPVTCSWLDALVLDGYAAISQQPDQAFTAIALRVLAHQSFSAVNVQNQAKGECFAIQVIPAIARILGPTARQGRILTEDVWHQYPQEPYRTSACRNGGAFDLHPHSAVWP